MLCAHAIGDDKLEVQVMRPHFHDDLIRLKSAINPRDRVYNDLKQVWIIFHASSYAYLPWVDAALTVLRPPRADETKFTQETMW